MNLMKTFEMFRLGLSGSGYARRLSTRQPEISPITISISYRPFLFSPLPHLPSLPNDTTAQD